MFSFHCLSFPWKWAFHFPLEALRISASSYKHPINILPTQLLVYMENCLLPMQQIYFLHPPPPGKKVLSFDVCICIVSLTLSLFFFLHSTRFSRGHSPAWHLSHDKKQKEDTVILTKMYRGKNIIILLTQSFWICLCTKQRQILRMFLTLNHVGNSLWCICIYCKEQFVFCKLCILKSIQTVLKIKNLNVLNLENSFFFCTRAWMPFYL